eukprot:Rmarinus@m.24786
MPQNRYLVHMREDGPIRRGPERLLVRNGLVRCLRPGQPSQVLGLGALKGMKTYRFNLQESKHQRTKWKRQPRLQKRDWFLRSKVLRRRSHPLAAFVGWSYSRLSKRSMPKSCLRVCARVLLLRGTVHMTYPSPFRNRLLSRILGGVLTVECGTMIPNMTLKYTWYECADRFQPRLLGLTQSVLVVFMLLALVTNRRNRRYQKSSMNQMQIVVLFVLGSAIRMTCGWKA